MKLLYFLFCLLSLYTSSLFSQTRPPTVEVAGSPTIAYPQQALIEAKAGLVICRIVVDSNQQYLSHRLLYATSPLLEGVVAAELSHMEFSLFAPHKYPFHFIMPFVFDLQQGKNTQRSTEELLADGQACLKHGLYQLSLRYFDPILRKKHLSVEQTFQVHGHRRNAYIKLQAWADARAELSNMIPIRQHMRDPAEPSEASLRVQRMLLSILSGQESLTVSDIYWLEQHDIHHVSFLSHLLEKIRLRQSQVIQLARQANELRSLTPSKTHFWLKCIEALAYQKARSFEQSNALLTQLELEGLASKAEAALIAERGWSHYLQAKPEAALSILQDALALDPQLADAHYYRALCLERIGYHEEALTSLTQALSLGLYPQKQAQGQLMMAVIASATNR